MTASTDPRGSPYRRTLSDRLADIRAIGTSAPLRGVYEASKRVGGHRVIFGSLVPSSKDPENPKSPFSFSSVPPSVRQHTLAAADRICDGHIELFGRDLQLGNPPAWHTIIDGEGDWPVEEWWRIDIRSDARAGDVKWAWELGRHRHLVLLARAAFLEPSKKTYTQTLNRHLDSWLESNPPEMGIHWYSNLEISLRALAWLQILALAGDSLDSVVRHGMWQYLFHSGRHLIADLPYTLSTMRNNHLLGDSLGLIALGTAFGGRRGRRWSKIGNRLFDSQLKRHMKPDGSMIEDSVSYHRFVLEMLSMRMILGDASNETGDALERSAQFLARLGVLEGAVPQYGDWDEGRVFAVSGGSSDLAGSVLLALSLSGTGATDEWREAHDGVAWFTDTGTPVTPDEPETRGHSVGGDIARAEIGPWTVWLKGGHGPSHGHADLSSVAISWNEHWIIGDPGTGIYNGDIELRNRLRSSVSHSVARVDGTDQLAPHRVFRWRYDAVGVIGEPIEIDGTTIMWSVHNAYLRLEPPRRLVRVVAVSNDGVEIADIAEGEGAHLVTSLPFGPECGWNAETSEITLGDQRWTLSSASKSPDDTTIHDAVWSETYGEFRPSLLLEMTVRTASRSVWRISENDRGASTLNAVAAQFHNDSVAISFPRDDRFPDRTVEFPR